MVEFRYLDKPTLHALKTQPLHPGQCHCGSVRFAVKLLAGISDYARCNCSLCKRRGAVMAFVDMADFAIEQGSEVLTLYQFNSNTAKHYFCRHCGVYTHHKRRSVPTQFAVNIACLDGIDPFVLADVPVIDGAGSHPNEA